MFDFVIQVLLELSDLELECGLGITHPMHRKKLRLAIEEHRHPSLVRYPCIAQLGHTWVSSEWLPDLGLAQVPLLFYLIIIIILKLIKSYRLVNTQRGAKLPYLLRHSEQAKLLVCRCKKCKKLQKILFSYWHFSLFSENSP